MGAPTDPTSPDPAGEVGAARSARGDLADLRLVRRAIAQGWRVPKATKARAVERMTQILECEEERARGWTAAARTLISMTTATTSAIGTAIQAHQHEVLAERVAELEERIEQQQQPKKGGASWRR